MNLLYLDYNCFQREFDDQTQARIHIETLSCQQIFNRVEKGFCKLAWSFMHLDEANLCPFQDRKYESLRLARLCKVKIGPSEQIRKLAITVQDAANLAPKDALHLACAMNSGADYFLSCDDDVVKRSGRINMKMKVMNPIDFCLKENYL